MNALRVDAEVRRVENGPVDDVGVPAQLAGHVFWRAEHGSLLDHRIPRGDHAGDVAAGEGLPGRGALGGELAVREEKVIALRRGVETHLGRGIAARGARVGTGRGDDLRRHPQPCHVPVRPGRAAGQQRAGGVTQVASRGDRMPDKPVRARPRDADHVLAHARGQDRQAVWQRGAVVVRHGHAVEPALVPERATAMRDQPPDQLDPLPDLRRGMLQRGPVPVLVHPAGAAAHAQHEAAAGQRLDVGRGRREGQRRAGEQRGHAGADDRGLGDRRERRRTGQAAAVVVVDGPERMDAGAFGRPDDLQGIGWVLIHDHEPDPHRCPPSGCGRWRPHTRL